MTVAPLSPPILIAHRGASGYRPEHTLAAYELAIEQGANFIEPDLVPTKDGVLVARHENEISGTTDVAAHPEFAARRATKVIDGVSLTGWFTEDFIWAELATLRARERIPTIRQSSSSFDGQSPIMRLAELLELLDGARDDTGRAIGLVAEIKHASYFESIGLPLDELVAEELVRGGWNSGDGRLTVESFEKTVLDRLRDHGIRSKNVFLLEAAGSPPDLVARFGADADSYASFLSRDGLRMLRRDVEGISVDKAMVRPRPDAESSRVSSVLVDDAHSAGLEIYCWTLRPENRFLSPEFRRGTDASAFGDWQSEFALILATGIDGVFADQADLAVAARDSLFRARGTVGGSA